MADAAFWQTYANALSVFDPSGSAAGEIAPTIYSSNALVTIPNLDASNANVNTAFWASDIVTNRVRINTSNATSWLNVGTSNTPWTNNEFGANALTCVGGGANGVQYLYGGADGSNLVSYLQSVGNSTFRPLVLNGRGGNVGVGTATPVATLDVSGAINASGNVTSPNITTTTNEASFGSNKSVWTSNALTTTNANVARLRTDVDAAPIIRYDLETNVVIMTGSNVSVISDGTFPAGGSNAGQYMPIALAGWYIRQLTEDSWVYDRFTTARLDIRGTVNRFDAYFPNLFTRLNIMYSSNENPFVWQNLKNTGGSNAIVRIYSAGHNCGYSAAQSEWFTYPSDLISNHVVPVYLGLQIGDSVTQKPTNGFRLRSVAMSVR